jgi:hypothetical protein
MPFDTCISGTRDLGSGPLDGAVVPLHSILGKLEMREP